MIESRVTLITEREWGPSFREAPTEIRSTRTPVTLHVHREAGMNNPQDGKIIIRLDDETSIELDEVSARSLAAALTAHVIGRWY